jgi:hypothetical protein
VRRDDAKPKRLGDRVIELAGLGKIGHYDAGVVEHERLRECGS